MCVCAPPHCLNRADDIAGNAFMPHNFTSLLTPKTFPDKPVCPNAEYRGMVCGPAGINREDCTALGGCYDATSDPVSPACYYTMDQVRVCVCVCA